MTLEVNDIIEMSTAGYKSAVFPLKLIDHVGEVRFELTKPEGTRFTVSPNSPTLTLSHVVDEITLVKTPSGREPMISEGHTIQWQLNSSNNLTCHLDYHLV